jgi:hypothetical protein
MREAKKVTVRQPFADRPKYGAIALTANTPRIAVHNRATAA